MLNSCIGYSIFLVLCKIAFALTTINPDEESFEYQTPCDKNWHLYGKYCYILDGTKDGERLSWNNASARCSEMGGHLASIHSEKQNDFLANYMKWDSAHSAWIGLHDRRKYNIFEWVDGTEVDYENWILNRMLLIYNQNDCVQMLYWPRRLIAYLNASLLDYHGSDGLLSYHGKWDDTICSERKAYICQKEIFQNVIDEDAENDTTYFAGGTFGAILAGVYLSVSFWIVTFAGFAYHKRKWIEERFKEIKEKFSIRLI